MISKRCDNCEVLIEVDDDSAGQKVACPECGDINRIPAAPVAGVVKERASGDRATAAGLPPDSGPEERVAVFRPAMLRARPLTFFGVSLAMLAGIAGVVNFGLINTHQLGMIASLVVVLAGVGVMVVWKIKTLAEGLEITNKRSIARRGLLSKATSEVLHDNIRNIQITQTMWQRVWGVGKMGISSAGQDGLEIDIKNLPRPDKIREMIDLYRPL